MVKEYKQKGGMFFSRGAAAASAVGAKALGARAPAMAPAMAPAAFMGHVASGPSRGPAGVPVASAGASGDSMMASGLSSVGHRTAPSLVSGSSFWGFSPGFYR